MVRNGRDVQLNLVGPDATNWTFSMRKFDLTGLTNKMMAGHFFATFWLVRMSCYYKALWKEKKIAIASLF